MSGNEALASQGPWWIESSPGVYERHGEDWVAEDDRLWNEVPNELIQYAIANMRAVGS